MTTRAVFLDALGTLVELEPPWVHLAPAIGLEPGDDRVRRAFRAEMSYYRDHSHEAGDAGALADLRERCARLLSSELGTEVSVERMMAAIRFRAYPDAEPALASLRDRGMALVCVSNWDCSLSSVLDRCGLGPLLHGVVTSAEWGARKPDPAIFERALELAGCAPEEALHVGDTPAEDLAGAEAAGIPAVLIARDGGRGETGRRVGSLAEIEQYLSP
jgi:putative hydrolase of the HAD superfamily